MKMPLHNSSPIPLSSRRGSILTGMALVFSILMITMAFVLLSPIQTTSEMSVHNHYKLQASYFAHAGEAYFRTKILQRNGESPSSPWKHREELTQEGKKGWFELEVVIDPKEKSIYNVTVVAGPKTDPGQAKIICRYRYQKGKLVRLEWDIKYKRKEPTLPEENDSSHKKEKESKREKNAKKTSSPSQNNEEGSSQK